ncbi:MAG: kinD [Burkholderiales bacterium]|jgi:signal transduction histidine kinase|nr:kinD [Burkholderiales bacterium]
MKRLNKAYSRSMLINFTIFWFLYILIYLLLNNLAPSHSWTIVTVGQLGFNLLSFHIGFKLYKRSYGTAKRIFFWWSIAFIFGFIADFFYNSINNILLLNSYRNFSLSSLYQVPFLVSLVCHNIAWMIIVAPVIDLKKGQKLVYHIPIFIMGVIVLTIFIFAFGVNTDTFSLSAAFRLFDTILEIIGFILVSICFVATNITPIRFLATGFLLVIICDLILKINFVYLTLGPNNLMDVGWVMGLMFMSAGLYGFNKFPVSFRYWNSRANTIQLQFTFWIFIVCILFIGIFITLNYFIFPSVAAAYHRHIKVLGCFLVVLSILILWVSYIFTKRLLQPLDNMRDAIKKFVSTNQPEIKLLESNYGTVEFRQLNNFIRESFVSILERQKFENAFISNAAQIVHDMGSPLTTMEVAIRSLEERSADKDTVNLLKSSVISARSIAGNFLNQYKNFDSHNLQTDIIEPRLVILSTFIDKLVENKRIEWNDPECSITLKLDLLPQMWWVFISPLQMSRHLSNLLNNAYESQDIARHNINIYVSVIDNNFELVIEDNGRGIPEDKIDYVLSGKSLKPGGHGIGLSRAVEYFKSLGGTLQLESTVGVGTIVRITIPVAPTPLWYTNVIKYTDEQTFVVLDDDIAIHSFWQKKLNERKINSKHFVSSNDFLEWYDSEEEKPPIVLLIDYDLHTKEYTGLEIIQKLNRKEHTYLITSKAESYWLQNAIVGYEIKLLPKYFIEYIILTKEALT